MAARRSDRHDMPRTGAGRDAFRTVESRSDVRDRLIFLGLTPQTSPPPETLQGFIDSELVRWGKVVKSAGLAGTE
jgi:tripartite-type tricarboxylate transporter receptor subunit TctC